MVPWDSATLKEIELNEWELSVKKYCAGEHPYQTEYQTISCGQVPLIPWSQIKGLEDVSGIGTYRSKIHLKDNAERYILSIEDASDTVKVLVNGKMFLPNQITREVEITEGICAGDNEIQIEVATTLNNALFASGNKKVRQDYGLMGSVKLRTY